MSITEFIESPGYKKFMGKVYGIAGAIVILGALWKILHLTGANIMLIIGLGTEALIFLLSAFEKPHEEPDWGLVYPELHGLDTEDEVSRRGTGSGGGSELAALVSAGHIEEADIQKISTGLQKLGETSSQLANLSSATVATESYLKNVKNASVAVSEFGDSQAKSAKQIEDSAKLLTQSYSSTASAMNEAGNKVASEIAKSGKTILEDINNSGKKLVSSYSSMSEQLEKNLSEVTSTNKNYSEQLNKLSSNLSSVNSLYEMQLKNSKEQTEANTKMLENFDEMSKYLQESAAQAKSYRDQVANLNNTVGQLNTIYGNMLSAMNTGR